MENKNETSRINVLVERFKKSLKKFFEKSSVIVMLLVIDIFVWTQVHEDALPVVGWVNDAFAQSITIENQTILPQEKEKEEEMEWIVAEFSAYTARVEETDSDPRTMASGKEVYAGAIACPAQYEFGTEIEVRDMGVYVCEDRMNIRYRHGEYFDFFFEEYEEAIQFGRQTLEYRVR